MSPSDNNPSAMPAVAEPPLGMHPPTDKQSSGRDWEGLERDIEGIWGDLEGDLGQDLGRILGGSSGILGSRGGKQFENI